jgi:hypothetical protein
VNNKNNDIRVSASFFTVSFHGIHNGIVHIETLGSTGLGGILRTLCQCHVESANANVVCRAVDHVYPSCIGGGNVHRAIVPNGDRLNEAREGIFAKKCVREVIVGQQKRRKENALAHE